MPVGGATVGGEAAAVLVALVYDSRRARPPPLVRQKERALGGEVGLEGRVKVEVVAGQVGEDERLEGDAGRALERQGVRRGLHDTRQVAAFDHLAKQALQLERIGRGELRIPFDAGDAVDHGAQKSRAQARGRKDRRQQVRGRRLAVGAGDGGDPQLAGRVAEEARRDECHGVPRTRHQDLGDRQRERALADERHGPGGERLGGEVVAVGLQSGDAEEQRSGSHVASVAGKRSDLDVWIAVDATTVKSGGESGYVHAR